MTEPSPAVAVLEISEILKKRKYIQEVRKPKRLSHSAVSVPKSGPESMLAKTNTAGKCLMRILKTPLKIDTVCSGTSCLSDTRKPASRATSPFRGVGLCGRQLDRRPIFTYTYNSGL